MNENKIKKVLMGGGNYDEENKKLLEEIEKLKSTISKQEKTIGEQAEELTKKKPKVKRDVDLYTIMNLQNFFKTDEYTKIMENIQ